jgi:hypothetical protein
MKGSKLASPTSIPSVRLGYPPVFPIPEGKISSLCFDLPVPANV